MYGRTSNPWDLDRTPGGSTEAARALAAGMTPLEIGSDIGGSIRVPAAYCGVYGHRPSETAVPRAGAFPFADLPNPAFVMGVQGPLARSAADLELLFDVVSGPVEGEDVAWRLDLPASRHQHLAEFRVAIMPPRSLVQPSADVEAKVDELASFLRRSGAHVAEAMPELDDDTYFRDYLTLFTMLTSLGQDLTARTARIDGLSGRNDVSATAQVAGLRLDAPGYLELHDRREMARRAWRSFFADWDVLVCPAALDVAFTHQTGPQEDRVLTVDDRSVPYLLNIVYPMWAIFAGQPATAFPAGSNSKDLPVGLQAIGPYLEDRTTLRFAQLLEREWHGFDPPQRYRG